MAECPKCGGGGWLWRHELPDPSYEPCDVVIDNTKYICSYCAGTGDAAAEIDRLRAENEALAEKLDKVAALVNNLPLTKIAVDGALIVSVTKYNALIDALRSEGE